MSHSIASGLPAEGFVRMHQIVGDPGVSEAEAKRRSTPDRPVKPRPARPGIVPLTEQHVRKMVHDGKFPQPVRLGPKIVVWRVEEVRAWIASAGAPKASETEKAATSKKGRN